tara:strand:- start:316 stop:492 length:177 start_codon:yes stop_codon:yes gene_type:complete
VVETVVDHLFGRIVHGGFRLYRRHIFTHHLGDFVGAKSSLDQLDGPQAVFEMRVVAVE